MPRKTPLQSQEAFFHEERPENILIRELSAASTYPLISVSCKYHPPSMRRSSPARPRRTFLLAISSRLRCRHGRPLVPERCCCLPSWRLYGNVRWLLGQYSDVYRGDRGPTNQSLTIRHICPPRVTTLYSCTVGSGYRSSFPDFPRGTAEKLKPAFSSACTCQTIQLSCCFTLQPPFYWKQDNYKTMPPMLN